MIFRIGTFGSNTLGPYIDLPLCTYEVGGDVKIPHCSNLSRLGKWPQNGDDAISCIIIKICQDMVTLLFHKTQISHGISSKPIILCMVNCQTVKYYLWIFISHALSRPCDDVPCIFCALCVQVNSDLQTFTVWTRRHIGTDKQVLLRFWLNNLLWKM